MSTDTRNQNISIEEGSGFTLTVPIYKRDTTPHTSSNGWEALWVLRSEADTSLVAVQTSTFTQTLDSDLDAVVDGTAGVEVSFTTATKVNPWTGDSETVVVAEVDVTAAHTGRDVGTYLWELRVWDANNRPTTVASGRMRIKDSLAT